MSFAGKVIIISGGAIGIGKETARIFALKGAAVAIVDNDQDNAAKAAHELIQVTGNDHIIGIKTDVSKNKEVAAMVDHVMQTFQRIDCLVNAAALRAPGTAITLEEEDWENVINVNLKGMFLTSKYCLPNMIESGGGAIVHISSVQSYGALKNNVAYITSKGGINALTRAMALDHAGDHIRVNAVCPGIIHTPTLQKTADSLHNGEQTLQQWRDSTPLGRLGEGQEIADFIVFLCSEQASFMTGGVYTVDGGLLAQLPC